MKSAMPLLSREKRPDVIKLGFVPANRGFFSQPLAAKMRGQVVDAMTKLGIEVIVPQPEETKIGCVENRAEAEWCAELFRRHDVQGVVIGAVNFDDEQAAAWTIKQARLDVPILLFGCQEEETLTMQTPRRDAFCGLLSIAEALRQIGAEYSVASRPIVFPDDDSFARDIQDFVAVCRVVNGIRRARYGQIGARPDGFWSCRFSEKQLQKLGPTTVVLDLSEAIAGVQRIPDDDPDLPGIARDLRGYADVSAMDAEPLRKIAKLELFLTRWGQANAIDAFAIQCWTSIQNNLGICSCTTMSRLSERGLPAACEADVLGTLSMHALKLAAGTPAALADWNNLHNEDDELVNLWHCGVFPRSFSTTQPKLNVHSILPAAGAAAAENSQGVIEMVARASPVTLARVTQRENGGWKALLAEGRIEDNEAATAGSYGWCRIPHLAGLYRDVLLRHFPHHVALTQTLVGNVLWEAFGRYLGFDVYHATQNVPGLYTPAPPFEQIT